MSGAVVPRGDGPVRPLPDAPSGVLDVAVTTAFAGPGTVRETLRRTGAQAFLVVHDGTLVCEHYARDDAAGAVRPLFSVTKSVVGCLAGRLLASGGLDPDAPVTRYVPDLAGGGYATASVRDVLDMRTGGDHRERYPGAPDGPDDETAALLATAAPGGSVRRWLAGLDRPAGDRAVFAYRSADTEVLGWVVEAAAGRPLPDLAGRHLLRPAGAEADGVWETDGAGHVYASGGLALRPRDVARLALVLLDGGAVGDRQVVPARFLRDTYVGQDDSVAAMHARLGPAGLDAPVAPKSLYRNQFWVLEQGRRVMLALGVHGQLVLVDGENRTAVVLLSQWPEPTDPLRFDAGLGCALAVAEALGGVHGADLSLHR